MRFNSVLLVCPTYQGGFYQEPMPAPSIGLGYIAQSLQRHGIDCSVLDMTLGCGNKDLLGRIDEVNADLIGISMMSFRYKTTYDLVNFIKRNRPNVSVIIGGAHSSSCREESVHQCNGVDFAVVGEGEQLIVELCNGTPLERISGLIYRRNGDVVFTGTRSFVNDLDSIEFPRYDPFELDKYESIHLSTSRGCPYRCTYCESHLVLGRKWRSRSAAHVVDEIEYWYTRGRKTFSLAEDNFAMNAKRVYEICRALKNKGMQGLQLNTGGIRADKVNKNLLVAMFGAGFRELGIGVEGGNDKVLNTIRKNETMADIENCIANACDVGFRIKLYFIIGSPNETWLDVQDSFNLALKYPVDAVNFYSMMPIPRTELYDWVVAHGKLLKPPEDYLNNDTPWTQEPFFDAPGMSLDEKRKALAQGLRVQRQVSARCIMRKRFGKPAVIVSDVIHSNKMLYHMLYETPIIRSLIKRISSQ